MKKMIEKAKEELEALETQHPNRFDYLKLELKSFICLLQSQLLPNSSPSTSTVTTQASTTRMKRKRVSLNNRRKSENENEFEYSKKVRRPKDRVDVVLDNAQACLRKIQELKFSLIY